MKTIKRILSQMSISKLQQKFLLILFPMYPDHPLNDSDDLPVLFGLLLYVLTQCRPHRTQLRLPNSFITLSIINQRLYVYLHPLGSYCELSEKIYPLPLYDPETQHEPKTIDISDFVL